MTFFLFRRALCACIISTFGLAISIPTAAPQAAVTTARQNPSPFPYPEKLTYRIEWHAVTAGLATAQLSRTTGNNWQFDLNLQSAGLVTRLYRVSDSYKAITTDHFCALSTFLDAQEGKRHRQTQLTFQPSQRKVTFYERDLVKNTTDKSELQHIAPCTHDIIGALATLRILNLEPGKTAMLPVTNGKKMVDVRVDAQTKENITVGGKAYSTMRYEAFLFDDVLYKRKGRMFLWITNDAEHLPVQMRLQLGFPVGTVTVELEKEERM